MTSISSDEVQLLYTNMCQAVGDPKRIQILYALSDSPQHVNALANILNTPQPTISRHLARLRERGLVTTERDGTMTVYSLAEPRIIDILDQMRALLRDLIEQKTRILDENQ
jgi:DNA-binding transcriptional ArsR family regulator